MANERAWDEVNGMKEDKADSEEKVSDFWGKKNYLRAVEDAVEQNDNSFDGIINNMPDEDDQRKAIVLKMDDEEMKKSSVLRKLQEEKMPVNQNASQTAAVAAVKEQTEMIRA